MNSLANMEIKALYFGDSIMAYDGKPFPCDNEFCHDDINEVCVGYPTILQNELGIINKGNFAVGGNTILDQLPKILENNFQDTDLVVITIGCNDFSIGVPLGTVETEDENTFCGAYSKAIMHIKKCNPHAKIVLMTPIHRNTLHRKPPYRINCSSTVTNGKTLYDFAEMVKKLGEKHDCFVVDMMNESGITMENTKDYTFEGVHPTNKGYRLITPPLIKEIKRIFDI